MKKSEIAAKRKRLRELEREFSIAGGRGVELADEIDALSAELDGERRMPDLHLGGVKLSDLPKPVLGGVKLPPGRAKRVDKLRVL